LLIDKLKPVHKKREEFLKDKTLIKGILDAGRQSAGSVAEATLKDALTAMKMEYVFK
jgi:hypothetical protein